MPSRGRVDVMSADETARYATEYRNLYRLEKETFDRILTHYPDFTNNIQATADARRAEIDARAHAAKKAGQKD